MSGEQKAVSRDADEETDHFDVDGLISRNAQARRAETEALRVGQASLSERSQALGKSLSTRMTADAFAARFRQLESKEDSMFNRSSALEGLIAKRSSKERLVATGILRGGVGVGDGAQASRLAATQERLRKQMTANKLSTLISRRSDEATLKSRSIYVSVDDLDQRATSLASRKSALGSLLEARISSSASSSSSAAATGGLAGHLQRGSLVVDGRAVDSASSSSGPEALISPVAASSHAGSQGSLAPCSLVFKPVAGFGGVGGGGGGGGGVTAQAVACGWGHTAALASQPAADGSSAPAMAVWTFGTPENGRLGRLEGDASASSQPEGGASSSSSSSSSSSFPSSPASAAEAAQAAARRAAQSAAGSAVPGCVQGLPRNVTAFSSGDSHGAAIADGSLFVWGAGAWGRLGLGGPGDEPTAVRVFIRARRGSSSAGGSSTTGREDEEESGPGKRVKAVSCGAYHTLALTEDGQVYACGWGKGGRLGIGAAVDVAAPPASTRADAAASAAGVGTGAPAPAPQLSPSSRAPQLVPAFTLVQGALAGVDVVGVVAGDANSAAWDSSGRVYVWGAGACGLLGERADAPDACALVPRLLSGLGPAPAGSAAGAGAGGGQPCKVVRVALGVQHALALDESGRVYSWGLNRDGQLGRAVDGAGSVDGGSGAADEVKRTPSALVRVLRPQGSVGSHAGTPSSSSSASSSAAATSSSSTSSSSESCTPAQVTRGGLGGERVVVIRAGKQHSLAVTASGKLFAWGKGAKGCLGTGDEASAPLPVAVSVSDCGSGQAEQVVDAACGWSHSVVATKSGKLFTAGSGTYGKLGH